MTLTPADRELISALAKDHLRLKAEIVAVEQQILALYDRREELIAEKARVAPKAIAEKFDITQSYAFKLMGQGRGLIHSEAS